MAFQTLMNLLWIFQSNNPLILNNHIGFLMIIILLQEGQKNLVHL